MTHSDIEEDSDDNLDGFDDSDFMNTEEVDADLFEENKDIDY